MSKKFQLEGVDLEDHIFGDCHCSSCPENKTANDITGVIAYSNNLFYCLYGKQYSRELAAISIAEKVHSLRREVLNG
jgi:hypothetical protein